MIPPLVSVLVVTWNRREEVLETVQSIFEQSYKNFEIIVVDNGSTDGTVEALRQLYSTVVIVELDCNVGVTAGRNAGFEVAKGDIILCLDSDASPATDTLRNIVGKFQLEPKIGVINSKIVDFDTREIGIAGWVYSEKDKIDQDTEFLSYSFSEGGCAIRKDVLEKVGLFWERLFFGYEGMEFSLRVLDANYDILYYPSSLVYHRTSGHSRIGGGERDKFLFTSCLLVYTVRYPWWLLVIFMPIKIGATFLRAARKGYVPEIFRGLVNFLKEAPSVLRERKPVRDATAIKYLKLQRQHGSLRWGLAEWLRQKTRV